MIQLNVIRTFNLVIFLPFKINGLEALFSDLRTLNLCFSSILALLNLVIVKSLVV